jgi:hypothetical protein
MPRAPAMQYELHGTRCTTRGLAVPTVAAPAGLDLPPCGRAPARPARQGLLGGRLGEGPGVTDGRGRRVPLAGRQARAGAAASVVDPRQKNFTAPGR